MREITGWIVCQIQGRGVSELGMLGNSNDEGYDSRECDCGGTHPESLLDDDQWTKLRTESQRA